MREEEGPGASRNALQTVTLLERELFASGVRTMLLDGDQVRHGLSGDLGFSERDRADNIRRVGEVAKLFFEQGSVVICTFVSPYRRDRDRVLALFPPGAFLEVFVDCPLEECMRRDPKGLYRKSLEGAIPGFTGVSAPYEPPEGSEVVISTSAADPAESANALISVVRAAIELRVDR